MKTILIACLLLMKTLSVCGQNPGLGLVIDTALYNAVPTMVRYNGKKVDDLPLTKSLLQYAPLPRNQGRIGSCVAWAGAYGALTIMESHRDNLTDIHAITERACSALFVYNQTKISGCPHGSLIPTSAEFLKNVGDIDASEFDHSREDCEKFPSEDQLRSAGKHRIKAFSMLFAPDASARTKIIVTKQSLVANKPVVLGMKITEGFMSAYETEMWNASISPTELGGHAMTVVGYSDIKQAFQLFNSWGAEWGRNGTIWVGYEDFVKYSLYGFQYVLEEVHESFHMSNMGLSGTFYLETPKDSDNRDEISFRRVAVRRKNNEYLVNESWQVGKFFQIVATGMKKDKYVYVYSVDPKNKGEIHFPLPQEGQLKEIFANTNIGKVKPKNADIIPEDNAEIIIPEPQILADGTLDPQVLYTQLPGVDYIVILFSDIKLELPELAKRIQKTLHDPQLPYSERYQVGFGDITVPASDITYQKKMMSFSSYSVNGLLVPLILRIDSKQ